MMSTLGPTWFALGLGVLCAPIACGGEAESTSNSSSGGSGSTTTTNSSTTVDPTTSTGGGGTTSGQVTTTGGGTDGVTTGAVTTTGGSVCPSQEPAEGTACSREGQWCSYPNCTAPDYRDGHELTCAAGAWQLMTIAVCETNGAGCPDSTPYRGQSCDPALTPGPCTSVDACGAARALYCSTGIWDYDGGNDLVPATTMGSGGTGSGSDSAVGTGAVGTSGSPPPVVCPASPPALGSSCCPSDYPAWCDYSGDDLVSSGTSTAVSTGGGAFTSVVTSAAVTSGTTGSITAATCFACGTNMLWEMSTLCP